MKNTNKIFIGILGLLLLLGSFPLIVHALYVSSAYTVDRLTDNNPAGGGQGTGLTGDLRYAITRAQAGDHITFSVTGTINLVSSLPSLTRSITIEGREPTY